MSKALVIKDANFSANKVTTVTFLVPCEGISFSVSTITITDYTPVTITYTLTPPNTSEVVTWASSDSTIVTVENGVLTVHGIGTCTVTATCGSYSASATVTVNIAYVLTGYFASLNTTGASGAKGYSQNFSRIVCCGSGEQQADYGFFDATIPPGVAYGMIYPILIPQNTHSVKISVGYGRALLYNSNNCYTYWAKNEEAPDSSHSGCCTVVSEDSGINIRSEVTETVAVPSGADCFSVMFRTQDTYTSSDNAAAILQQIGVQIEFIPAD